MFRRRAVQMSREAAVLHAIAVMQHHYATLASPSVAEPSTPVAPLRTSQRRVA